MKKLTAFLLTVLLLTGLLTGCGSASVTQANKAVREEAMAPAEAPAAMAGGGGSLRDTGSAAAEALPENRKWIITMDIQAETEDLDALLQSLTETVASLDGYAEDQNIHNGSTYSSRRYRSASLTLRIPAQRLPEFTQQVEGAANVVSKNERREDITLTYVDTQARVTALETEQKRLLELMEQAETMADLLEIEGRLTQVRYELESYASQLRTFDNQVDYATVYLHIEEVQEYTPVAEKTVWQRIRDGFTDSLEGLWEGAVDLLVWVLASSPYLVVWGGILTGGFFLLRRLRLPKPRKKAERTAPEAPKADSE